jgi:acyl carrier protein
MSPAARALPPELVALVAELLGCPAEAVRPDARLQDGLGADSLALAQLADALETRLGWVVTDRDLERWVRVSDLLAPSPPPPGRARGA